MSGARTTRSRARIPSTTSVPSKASSTVETRSKATRSQPTTTTVGKRKSIRGKKHQAQDVWCICRGPDDRTPMIRCESCKDWFHFACIGLSDREAEDIQLYICSACHDKTGQSTVHEWEGSDAVEEYLEIEAKTAVGGKASELSEKGVVLVDDPGDDDEAEVDDASGDDYKEEQPGNTGVRRGRGTQIITSSDDDETPHEEELSRRAPSRRSQLKRKRGRESHTVSRKRPRQPSSGVGSDSDDADNKQNKQAHTILKRGKHDAQLDPTRKYCSGKLREVLLPIFVQFARFHDAEGATAELDEESRTKAEGEGTAYVQDLEQCLFETYGEIDKSGSKTASGKYKDRFRMLSFNLSQPDRYLLRRNIGTHTLPAKQLSTMSSVELANEQTKLQIEAANRESLEHSILAQRPIAARAKITHKGEEIIEDLVGDDVGRRIRDEEQRETEREREREKDARERAKMPPPSPQREKIAYQGPQDILAQQHSAASQKAAQAQAQAQAQRPSVLTVISSTTESSEPTFKFDDLIAIDLPEGSPSQEGVVSETPGAASTSPATDNKLGSPSSSRQAGNSSPLTKPRSGSFDLSNVWSGSPSEDPPMARSGSPIPSRADDPREGATIDIDLGTAADDEDFDMFLDQAEVSAAASGSSGPEQERAAFEALPIVWGGHLNLPDAGKAPAVQARQVGGRPIDITSTQWQVLFPTQPAGQLKVDGRVPVKESAKYMTQNRLNVTRELVIVAFTPTADRTDFDEIVSFLVNRDRHAVVHPWGPNPSPDAPGKELYLIPIMPQEVLPDYVEILDLVKFPKHRDEKILLGVFILNKGRFTERVLPRAVQPSGLPLVSPVATSVEAPISSPQASTIPPEIVSKLTPQQIESLLHTVLSGGGMNSLPLQQPPPQHPHPQPQPATTFPATFPPSLANLVPQQQYPTIPYPQYPQAGMTPPQQQYPQSLPHQPPSMPYSYPPPTSTMPSSPPRDHDYRRSPPYGNDHSRPGELGGRRGVRGSGRNFSGDRGRGGRGDFDRPRDSGWGGRGRGRGGPQQSSPRPW